MENIFGVKGELVFSPWSITYLWGSLHVSVCSVYRGRNIPRSPLKIVMEFGQSMTVLESPIQYVQNRAPSGQYLAPQVIVFWLFLYPAWASSALRLLFPLVLCLISLWGAWPLCSSSWEHLLSLQVNWTIVASLTSRWFCVPANFTFLALKSLWGCLLSYVLKTVKTSNPKLLPCPITDLTMWLNWSSLG